MPVYGDFFEGTDAATKAETGQPIMTSQPIVDLLAYLQTLQQESGELGLRGRPGDLQN